MTTDDLLADLARLQSYAAGLQSLLQDAQARSPQTAQGSDHTGAVTLTVGQDGLPRSIRVGADWARKIQPAAFGDAVVEASQAALGQRMAAWVSALERDGWQAKVDRLESELDGQAPRSGLGPAPGVVPPAFRRAPDAPPPRPLDVVAEDALRALDAAEQFSPPSPTALQGSGRAAGGRLSLAVSPGGLVGCRADPRWAAGQSPAALANAFSQAITEARTALADAVAAAPVPASPAGRLGEVFSEVMALLGDPQRLAGS